MKVTDLMVGDYVYDRYGNICIVRNITDSFRVGISVEVIDGPEKGHFYSIQGYVEPVALTRDILLANGFTEVSWENNSYECDELKAQYVRIQLDSNSIIYGGGDQDHVYLTCKYIYELNHFLKLLHIDKKIKLIK